MPVHGAAARRAEAKRIVNESAELAHVSMKVANNALEELRDLRDTASPTPATVVVRKGVKKKKMKKTGAGYEARPTSASAQRAAETTAELDVKNAARVKTERIKRRILGRCTAHPPKPLPTLWE